MRGRGVTVLCYDHHVSICSKVTSMENNQLTERKQLNYTVVWMSSLRSRRLESSWVGRTPLVVPWRNPPDRPQSRKCSHLLYWRTGRQVRSSRLERRDRNRDLRRYIHQHLEERWRAYTFHWWETKLYAVWITNRRGHPLEVYSNPQKKKQQPDSRHHHFLQ